MLDFFKSSWFIGISTGLISGLLVYFITNWIMKKKGKEEYYKQVSDANRYVIISLKPYISEKGLPAVDIFKAIIASTARAYSVKEDDMFSIAVYCEELIREIISDVYVSSDKKKEYTDNLIIYKNDLEKRDDEKLIKESKNDSFEGNIFGKSMASYLSIVTALSATLLTFIGVVDSYSFTSILDDSKILFISISIAASMIVAVIVTTVLESVVKRRRYNYRIRFDDIEYADYLNYFYRFRRNKDNADKKNI